MASKTTLIAALMAPLMLVGCVEPVADKNAAEEISRLRALGYSVTAQSGGGAVTVLRYSGRINASVMCGTGGTYRVMAPRVAGANGAQQDFKLNTYLILNAGSDGVVSARERDGIYVVSKTTRPTAGAQATSVESITFGPTGRGRFASGLTCRAS